MGDILERYPNLTDESKQKLRRVFGDELDQDPPTDPRGHKVTLEMCQAIKSMYEDGMSGLEIADELPISSPGTVYYHANGKCAHEYRLIVTYSECGWMRYKAINGASAPEIANEYDTNPRTVHKHVTGDCDHSHGCQTVTSDQLGLNAVEGPAMTTSRCDRCSEKFEHKEYIDRRFCSKQCNVEHAAEVSARNRATDD